MPIGCLHHMRTITGARPSLYYVRRTPLPLLRYVRRTPLPLLRYVRRTPLPLLRNVRRTPLPLLRNVLRTPLPLSRNVRLQDQHTEAWFLYIASSRWMSLRLDATCALFVGLLSFVSVAYGNGWLNSHS